MTSATLWGWSDRRPLRIAIACAATFDCIWLAYMTRFDVANDWQHADPGPVFGTLAAVPGLHLAVALACIGALWRFALRPTNWVTGSLALGLLFLIYETNAFATGFVMPEMHLAGSALVGWVVGALVAKGLQPVPADSLATPQQIEIWRETSHDRLAEAGAVAAMVANYAIAAASKWMAAGVQWDGRIIRRLLFAFREVDDNSRLASIADFIASHPWLPDMLAGGTLVIQTGSVLMLYSAGLRQLWGILLVSMHLTMTLTAGVMDPQLILLVALFCLPWPKWLRREKAGPATITVSADHTRRSQLLLWGAAATLAAAAWLLPIRQAMTVRFDVSQTPWDRSKISKAPHRKANAPVRPPAGPEVRAWLGGLAVGSTLADGEIVFISNLFDGAIHVDVRGPTGLVQLRIHRSAAGGRPAPATSGAFAVYYSGSAADGPRWARALADRLPLGAAPNGLAVLLFGPKQGTVGK
ncbi:MAG: hypothetical protein EXR77_18750 [Myxococcales bacterium]|nr:hypothetical protein [Myxococcales bacterium]